MKDFWKYGRTGGSYAGQVADEVTLSVPYTDQPPLEGTRPDGEPLTIDDQLFDPKENRWIVLMNVLDHNQLNNLEAMHEVLKQENTTLKLLHAKTMLNEIAIKQENTALKEKNDALAQINSKTMLATVQNSKDITTINEQLNPTTEEGAE